MTSKKKRAASWRERKALDAALERKAKQAEAAVKKMRLAEKKAGVRPRSIKTYCHSGHLHDSKGESIRCNTLTVLERAGKISHLIQQPQFVLADSIPYRADWQYMEAGRCIVEDFKGFEYPKFKIVKRLWPLHGAGVLRITNARGEVKEIQSQNNHNHEGEPGNGR